MIGRVRRGSRIDMRGESGLISAGAVILIGIALFLGYLLLAAFNGDTAQFGKVPIPGKATVKLPKGDVDVYYAEGVNPDAGIPLITPDDLQYTILDEAGVSVPVDSRGDDAKSTGDGLTRLIGAVQVPEDGTYTVETESAQTQQRITPSLTFGQGPFAAVKDRFDEVVDALKGPLGILVLLALVILIFIPRFRRARQRSSYKDS